MYASVYLYHIVKYIFIFKSEIFTQQISLTGKSYDWH